MKSRSRQRSIPKSRGLNLTLLRDEAGSVQGTVGVLREITERKQREQRLSVLQRVLRHNLRNELNVVMGQADLIARTVDDHDITEKAETIQETAERLRSLGEKARAIETMLQRDASHRQSVDVTAIIEASCESFREDYPDATIRTDLVDSFGGDVSFPTTEQGGTVHVTLRAPQGTE